MEKIVNSAELLISKTNCNTNQGLAIGEENIDEEEEEEIDDDEEAL